MFNAPGHFTKGTEYVKSSSNRHSPAPALLALPTLSKTIPASFIDSFDPSILRLARILSNANILTAADRAVPDLLGKVLQNVLLREINAATGPLKVFALNYSFSTDHSPYSFQGQSESNDNQVGFSIGLTKYMPYINIQKALNTLAQFHPDLGQTIYAVIENASIRSPGILTFANCLNRFQFELHFVEDEEEIAEYKAEDIPYLTNEEVDELAKQFNLPWIKSANPVLTPNQLIELSQRTPCSRFIKDCISATLHVAAMYRLVDAPGLGIAEDNTTVFSLAAIELFEGDPTQQLFDDVTNEIDNCNDSYTENLHEESLPLESTERFIARWNEIRNGLKLIGALDNLLHLLQSPNKGPL